VATLSLRHVRKIYPLRDEDKKDKKRRKRKRGEPESEPKPSPQRLRITDEGVVAVDDFNLDIADKEFVVFVGPSGCGKSTTLRMIAGLEDITSGELYIDGHKVNDVDPKDRDIAMVFQNYALYPHMTVRQNLEFPLELRKVPKAEMAEKVEWAAEILGITPYLKRRPKALSGGQRQRVAIGRAIVRDPQVLLMDEPLSNLDAKLRNQMRAEIIKLRQRLNATFIYVTHDQTEAMTLGDRIVIMKDGDVQQIGTPQDVFDHPVNLFVAGFIGMPQMNLFDGELVRTDGTYAVRVGDAEVALSKDKQQNLSDRNVAPQKVIVGARPEHITLEETPGRMVEGVVDVSEMMGSSVHLHVNVQGKDCIIIAPRLDLDAGKLSIGSTVRFTFAPNAVHVFDPATEKNLEWA
jgi:multiple sugar transport system ATP-binding protein